jgi:HSP20 family protein
MTLLTRWRPVGSLGEERSRFQEEFDRLFNRWSFGLKEWPALAVSYPPVNVWEKEEFVYLEAELPGLKLEEVEIYVTGTEQLTIKGNRKPMEVPGAYWHRQERGFGAFERILGLPYPVEPAKIEAHLENGVLTVKMAKSPLVMPRRIPVKPL